MLDADLVIGPDDGAFQEALSGLDAVGVNVANDPLPGMVVDRLVPGVAIGDATVGHPLVRVDRFGVVGDVAADEAVEADPRPTLHNGEPQGAVSALGSGHGDFVVRVAPACADVPLKEEK